MYLPDYGNVELFLEDRRREAAHQRAHAELVRQARSDRRSQGGLLSQIKRLMPVRNQHQQQEVRDVRRATAV